ncbi:MAG: ABC transporter ATP-binding protein/permease [Chloroflexi bacterium]|nr:ABC transporter ATP-binding protein/permease [Chloroflexota bacterium]
MQSLRRMTHFVKPYWKASALALLLLVSVVAMDLTIPRLIQRIIDEGIAHHDLTTVWTTALLMLGASILSALLMVANTLLAVRGGQYFAADVRSALFRKIQSLSFGNLDRLQTGQLLIRLTSDVNQVQLIVMLSLRIMTRAPLMMIGSVILLILTSWELALLMLVLLPITGAVVWVFIARMQPLFLQVQRRLDKLNTVLQENLAGVRVVKAFVRAEHENARFDQANVALTNQTIRVMQFMSMLIPTMIFLMNVGTAAVIGLGGVQVSNGTLTVGAVVAFVNYLLSTMFPLLMLGMMAGPFSAAQASAGRIVAVLDSEPEVQDRPQARALPYVAGRIAFENVCFNYNHDCGEPVLKGVNLVAEPGQTVAILGATGAGKSTLVQLIPRFYDATEGRVTLDGVDVRDLPLESLRAQMGVALQEAVLFSGTIRDNIRYGRPDAPDKEVVAAAQAAQAHDFITAFPNGYDTLVGQRGVNLSGGQKQRLAIARALLVQPRILILDDSTSAVDVETESRIQDALDRLMDGRTSFVIAQRVSTVLNADKIVVLDRGQVAAEGTHAELLASSPIYQEIYQSQLGASERGAAHV